MATDNENRILNVPNLRFPEFSEEWKKTKIGDITSKVGSGVTPRGGSAVYKTAGHLFIRSQNVGNGCFLLDDVAYIDETTHKRQINTELKEGDVLLNITGASIGRSAVVDSSVAGGNVNQHVCIIRLQNNISPNFICNYLLSYGGQKQIDSFQAGGNREGLNFEQIRSIKFSIPSFEEQCKISTLLSLLDRRIATQNKIIEDLKKLKSAISYKLFARKDLLEKQITISEIGILKNGYAFQSSTYNPAGSHKIITIANVSGERYIDVDSYNCIKKIPDDIQVHQVLKKDDILISLTGNVGRVSLCAEGNYFLNQRVGLLQLKQDVNREYVYQALSSKRFEQTMIACGQGAAQMNIGKGDVENYTIPYSCNTLNMEIIASTLKTYDFLMSVEIDRLRLFHQQKQYLLAQMFI